MTLSNRKNQVFICISILLSVCTGSSYAKSSSFSFQQDTVKKDTIVQPYTPSRRPTFVPTDRYGDPFSGTTYQTPFFLSNPSPYKLDVEIDTGLNYTIYERFGDFNYRPTTFMTFEEFSRYQDQQIKKEYWQNQSRAADGESAVSGRSIIPRIYVSPVLDRIFGGSYVELIPTGFVTLDFGAAFQRINNPSIPIRQQRNGGFEFDQQINMGVVGKVGEKLAVTANFDNNNSFDFQNNMKVEYTGFKEEILRKFEIGNVSLPLNNTLIQGAQNLFGLKAQFQLGKLSITALASTQRGKTSSIDIQGGNNGQGRPFEIIASNYDENRHFFLGHFFRDNYESWVANTPQIISGVNITRVEVYVLNRNNDTQTTRNILGLMDLGEPRVIYNNKVTSTGSTNDNGANTLYGKVRTLNRSANDIVGELNNSDIGPLQGGTDYEKITTARKLSPTEFTVHPQLGYITLTRKLQNDEALAVSYEYTYNGAVFKVGELSEDYSILKEEEVIFMKLLRPRQVNIRDGNGSIIPTWNLMMKNIYSLNVNQLSQEGFQLRVIYRDDRTGIDNPQLQDGVSVRNKQLIEIFGLDRLNPVNDPQKDGNFDYVEGVTINSQNGLIIFPFLHPYDRALRLAFQGEPQEDVLVQKYVYDTLYRTTKADAELFATKNKFFIVGQYTAGSSKEIIIPGFGVSPGSVRVYAGGIPLQEGSQYTVDYTFGRVTILDESVLDKNLSIQYEQSDPFAFQTRSLLGTRFDYELSKDVNLGGTFLYYNERPQISRNVIGTEPARNMQYGLDFNINKESRLLTKLVDALPLIQTKEKSSFNINGEFAQLLPGTSNQIDGEGTGYIDDFETTATPYSLMNPNGWKLSSIPPTPEYDPFTEGGNNDIRAGFRRAKLAWYQIDNQFYRSGGNFKPSNITDGDLQNHYVRAVDPQEIFPNRNYTQGNFFEPILDFAFYPQERGPYNYNTDLKQDFIDRPRANWGGVTTAIRTEVDFDKSNIEYIEFWLLDPFITGANGVVLDGERNQNNTTGGKVVFQLGNVSEDVIRDGRFAFENGLPPNGDLTSSGVENTNWGYVTTQQYLTNAFDNSSSARANQDVGLDGIPNEKEFNFDPFQPFLTQAELPDAEKIDPSADDFQYFLGNELDAANAKILERYKRFNGQDGNSPIITGNDLVTPSSSPIPDSEDINGDNTLTTEEEYYEYNINLTPADMEVGKGYIVDKITTNNNVAKENVNWYLFRIPIRQYDNKVGSINGFKSIRYMRMLMSDFQTPVVMRMANFRMVGSRWRRYLSEIREGGLIEPSDPDFEKFTLSVVNLEENGEGNDVKSPYVIPPGVVRDRDNTSSIARQLNEQSVQMCVDNLEDGDGRAIYKNVSFDFFNYGRIKMYFHGNSQSNDDDLHAFIRFGTDFENNYYEIEIPLKITPTTNPNNRDPRFIWPEENEIDLDINALYALKVARDRENFPLTQSYPLTGPRQEGRHLLRIFGRPDLSSVQVIMIGVKNPKSPDQQAHSVCLWANELRLTDFDRTPGWAVNATMAAKLADFATIQGAFRYTTYGFGGVSSKISERTREESTRYDISGNFNLDKLIPGNHGIKLPMFVSHENTTINPNYDPANPDLKLEAALQSFQTNEERDAYVKLIRDETIRKGINFTNVRKVKVNPDARIHPWDIENFGFNYSYSITTRSNFNIQSYERKQYRGGIAYNYSPKATGFEPFKNSKGLSSPWLKMIKDINFSLLPSNVGARLDLDRSFEKNIYRNSTSSSDLPNYLKYFLFNRQYNLKWNLAKGLSLDYNALVNAVVDEPDGDIDTDSARQVVWDNVKKFGRMKMYDQSITANYKIPLDKIPITDWINADYRYQVRYNWKAGPINVPDEFDFGNIIQNSRDQNLSGRLDMVKLYNKSKFLKKINTPPRPPSRTQQARQPVDTTRQTPAAVKGFFQLLMSLRSITFTFTETEGTILPGFNKTPWLLGMDKDFNAPGWGFIFGDQDPAIRTKAAANNWLVQSPQLTTPFSQIKTTGLSLSGNIEPTPDFKIRLDVKKDASTAFQEIYRYDDDMNGYESLNPSRSGNYRLSTIAIKTAFRGDNDKTTSSVFEQFERNTESIKTRFAQLTGTEYDSISQDVLIPAFISAYLDKDVNTVSLSPFPITPLPNWRIDYTGLIKLSGFKDIFQSFTITHAYASSYSVVNYSNSLSYDDPNQVGINIPIEDYNRTYFGREINEDTGQPIPVYVISQVMVSESFQPLIGINLRTKGRFSGRVEYKTKRDLALNISNAQITEVNNKDIVMEMGYTKNNMKLPFKNQGRTIILKNDVTFRLNTTISDNKTIQRKIEQLNTITNGNVNFQLRPNISYVVNQKLNVQMYYEQTINNPLVSNSYRRSTTRFGFQVRFSLAQ